MTINYELIPSCPVPFSSIDKGELWLAGDYFMLFERFPLSALAMLEKARGEEVSPFRMPIIYPYAMPVLPRADSKDKRPLPLMVPTIEIANYELFLPPEIIEALKKDSPGVIEGDGLGPVFLCMFKDGMHLNFGWYNGSMERSAVRELFFKMLTRELDLKEAPVLAGSMRDAFGNPATGLPPLRGKEDI